MLNEKCGDSGCQLEERKKNGELISRKRIPMVCVCLALRRSQEITAIFDEMHVFSVNSNQK